VVILNEPVPADGVPEIVNDPDTAAKSALAVVILLIVKYRVVPEGTFLVLTVIDDETPSFIEVAEGTIV